MSSQHLRRAAMAVIVLAIATASAVVLMDALPDLRHEVAKLGVVRVLAAATATTVAFIFSAIAWTGLVRSEGDDLERPVGIVIFLAGQLGKYIPGGFGPVLAQGVLAKGAGIPARRVIHAYVLLVVTTLALGISLGTALLFAASLGSDGSAGEYRWTLLALPFLVPLLHPAIPRWLGTVAGRISRRSFDIPTASAATLGRTAAWTLLTLVSHGVHLFIIIAAFEDPTPRLLTAAIAIWGLAWSAGYIVVIVPAGLGVREVAMGALLTPLIGAESAAAAALASRVTITLTELVLGTLASAELGRRRLIPNTDDDAPEQGLSK